MGVDLLLVLRLEDKDDLDRNKVVRIVGLGQDELRGSINRKLRRVLQ